VCRDVDSDGSNADLVHDGVFREGFGRHSVVPQRSTKFRQGVIEASGIPGRIMNPHVEVFGVSWLGVFHDGVPTYDQILDLEFIQDA
jgi:hypothetical protein